MGRVIVTGTCPLWHCGALYNFITIIIFLIIAFLTVLLSTKLLKPKERINGYKQYIKKKHLYYVLIYFFTFLSIIASYFMYLNDFAVFPIEFLAIWFIVYSFIISMIITAITRKIMIKKIVLDDTEGRDGIDSLLD